MSKNPEPAERETLRTCSTRALNALGTLKHAIATFRLRVASVLRTDFLAV
jgi:hypothetical protein